MDWDLRSSGIDSRSADGASVGTVAVLTGVSKFVLEVCCIRMIVTTSFGIAVVHLV
jgi:hypothetical protein